MSVTVLRPFKASDAAWLARAHGRLYAAEAGFDDTFEPLVAGIIADFLSAHDPACERGWVAERAGERLGSIFCVRLDRRRAKLRLFLLEPSARGQGLGKRMLTTCMDFARNTGYTGMQLWTHESHRAACALYERHGWRCIAQRPVRSFGVDLVEQTWQIDFGLAPDSDAA